MSSPSDLKKFVNGTINKFRTIYDLDLVDRWKYTYCNYILAALTLFVFTKTYMGEPVQCWVPKQFKDGWEEYAEHYCFIEGSYYVHMNNSDLPSMRTRMNTRLNYYQWVPFIILMQGIALYAPRFLWKNLKKLDGMEVSSVTEAARLSVKPKDSVSKADPNDLQQHWDPTKGYLTEALLITKFASIVLISIQLILLNWFITDSAWNMYGINVITDFFSGRTWHQTGIFPRVTFCDFKVRQMGQIHNWSLQCVLMMNMINEKVFVFIWWMLVVLLFICIINLIVWIYRIMTSSQNAFLLRVLKASPSVEKGINTRDISGFRQNISTDGVVLLRLIDLNSTIFEAGTFIDSRWRRYLDDKRK